jgi:hypothetical protein
MADSRSSASSDACAISAPGRRQNSSVADFGQADHAIHERLTCDRSQRL